MMGGIRGLSSLRLPLAFTERTGARATIEMQVPALSLRNLVVVVRPYMGVMGVRARP